MAKELTAKTRSILNSIQKSPSVVLDIEGIDTIYSSSATFKKVMWDSGVSWDQSGIRWDGLIQDEDTLSYIDLSSSTNTIGQQIYPDKEGQSSISSFQVSMVDKNGSVSSKFALNSINEILGKRCLVSIGFVGGEYPADFMPVMNGFIVDYSSNGGGVRITVSHADALRKQSILSEYSSTITSSIDAVTTTVPVDSVSGITSPLDALETYIQVDDEKMKVTAILSSAFEVERGALGTAADTHDSEADVISSYVLTGFPLDLALKIMLSDGSITNFQSDIEIKSVVFVSPSQSIQRAVIFNDPDIEKSSGLIEGDSINVSTYGNLTVDGFGKLPLLGYSYILVEEDLAELPDASALTWSFRSQYNTLTFGLGMQPFEVDVQQFEEIKDLYAPNFVEMQFPIEEGIDNARDFINKELYFVAGCYGIPRNARSSVKFLSPPLSIEELPTIDDTTSKNILDLRPTRSINKFYYNDVIFKYGKSFIDGEFKAYSEYLDADSLSRFNVGKKQLAIESDGYRFNPATVAILDLLSGRYLDRYKQAATYIKGIKMPFKYGFRIDVGDVVFFGGSSTKMVDYETGKRNLPIEKYEVINQSISLNGEVTVDLLSTGFAIDGIFGVFSPSSTVSSGTTSALNLVPTNNAEQFDNEGDKWLGLEGCAIRVRSDDYTYDEPAVFTRISPSNKNRMEVSGLSSAPPANAIVELGIYANYEEDVTEVDRFIRLKYTFVMERFLVTTSISPNQVAVTDTTGLVAGVKIAIHSEDFTRDQFENTITDVTAGVLTLEDDIPFTPQTGDWVVKRSYSVNDGYLFL